MLKYMAENLKNAPDSKLKDSLMSLFTNLPARRYIKYNPDIDKLEIQSFEVYWKLSHMLENKGFNEPKKVDNTNIFVQIDSDKIYFWLE